MNAEIKATKADSKPKRKNKKRRPLLATTQAARIRTLTELGHPPREIAAMLGCNVQTVYNVQYKMRQSGYVKKSVKPPMKPELQNVKVQYAGPEPKLSFMQRLRVLFTGVV